VRRALSRALAAACIGLLAGACATATPPPKTATPAPPPPAKPSPPPAPAAPAAAAPAPVVEARPLPEAFESEDFVVAFAKPGDTPETLAARYLGDRAKAWMIEDYMNGQKIEAGREVVIPRRPWNLSGVQASGYQIIPILCYHNLGAESKGRLLLAASKFEEQMRYLKSNGYRVISLAEFVEFIKLSRQLPQRSVVLTFDDGYASFKQYAYPVLKSLGFTATLFVYTDYVGGGKNALSWLDLRQLAAEGFDIEAHSKTHGDLRRTPGEGDVQYAQRLQAELVEPQELFQKNLGHKRPIIAYPYGSWDEAVLAKAGDSGYVAGFSVRRQGNASFVRPLAGNRSQVYSEMTLEDFVKNLNVFQAESLK
jgi:peptidoglycan/xylan/chitin deacetylase (PgdA/CDA1 family)